MSESQTYHSSVSGESAPVPAPAWSRVMLLSLGLVAILALLYWPIMRDLSVQWWDDANYSHGFIVPIFSGYLIWRERDRLRALVPRGTAWGLLVLVGGIGALVLGDLGAENFLSRSSLIISSNDSRPWRSTSIALKVRQSRSRNS